VATDSSLDDTSSVVRVLSESNSISAGIMGKKRVCRFFVLLTHISQTFEFNEHPYDLRDKREKRIDNKLSKPTVPKAERAPASRKNKIERLKEKRRTRSQGKNLPVLG